MIRLNKDVCICCLEVKLNITKHHVVPHCYVQYLGENRLQNGNKVNLCRDCHDNYEPCATSKKKTYAQCAGLKPGYKISLDNLVGQMISELKIENQFILEWQEHFNKWLRKKKRKLDVCHS